MSLATTLPTTLPAIAPFPAPTSGAGGRQAAGDGRSLATTGKEEGASAAIERSRAGMAAKNSAPADKAAAAYARLQSPQEALEAVEFVRARIAQQPEAALRAQGRAIAQEALQRLA